MLLSVKICFNAFESSLAVHLRMSNRFELRTLFLKVNSVMSVAHTSNVPFGF